MTAVDAAIEALVKVMVLEIGPRRINAVAPGKTNTALWWVRMSADEQRAHFSAVAEGLPVQRTAEPEDIAHAVRFLLENPHVTGATIDVDGGQK